MQSRSLLRVASAMLLVASIGAAQLSGVLVVDNLATPGPGVYNTLQACATDIQTLGVSGAVQVLVVNNGSPYAGFTLASAPGSGGANTITFTGIGQPIVNTAAAGFLQGMRFGTTSLTTAGGPSAVTVDGFDVTGIATGAGIGACQCPNFTVRNCHVYTCGAGIALAACATSLVEDNEVNNVAATPGAPHSTNTHGGAIASYYNNHSCTIRRNNVHDCTGNGIHAGSSGSTTAPLLNVIANNMVYNCTGLGSWAGGISLRRGTTTIANNSVHMTTGSFGGIALSGQTSGNFPAIMVANNIVKHDGTGSCFRHDDAAPIAPTTFDNNLYDPAPTAFVGAFGATTYPTLVGWQAAPGNAGKELNSIQGPASFISVGDLHITPASLAFEAGQTIAGVTDDFDGNSRPLGANYDIGADEVPATGLFAAFTASATTGEAGQLNVSFTDTTFSSSGPITSWSWNFGDGNTSTLQNPTNLYMCPGVYTVTLTADDGINPTSTVTKTNFISATQQKFHLFTSGGGVGDLVVTPVPTGCGAANGAVQGWSLLSLTPPTVAGTGPFFGIVPDALTFLFLYDPASPGNPVHFVVFPPLYPDGGPLSLPAGSISNLTGLTLDGVMIFLNGAGGLQHWTNVARITV